MDKSTLIIRSLHCQPYELTWEAMKDFTRTRDENTADELWLLQHPPVFTQGQAGKPEHLLNPHEIPVVQTDRGGQITYHGPGQLMAYCLFNLKRRQLGPRQLVSHLEKTVIDYLSDNGITAEGNTEAHGVYVNQEKICSIGLRVSRGCSYHGIALNINVDLTPFQSINPCGFQGLIMTKLQHFTPNARVETTQTEIIPYFCSQFGYTSHQITDELPQALAQ